MPKISLYLSSGRNAKHICAHSAFHGKIVNIADIYIQQGLDCGDIYEYDRHTGYHTRSVLTIPLMGHENISIGILQLLNYKDPSSDQITGFPAQLESLVLAFASLAAMVHDKARLIEQEARLIEQLNSDARDLAAENRQLREKAERRFHITEGLIGESPAIQAVIRSSENVLEADAPVLLLGTGKEVLAKLIHRNSHRGRGPFVPYNCAAVPENLLESELFGTIGRGKKADVALPRDEFLSRQHCEHFCKRNPCRCSSCWTRRGTSRCGSFWNRCRRRVINVFSPAGRRGLWAATGRICWRWTPGHWRNCCPKPGAKAGGFF